MNVRHERSAGAAVIEMAAGDTTVGSTPKSNDRISCHEVFTILLADPEAPARHLCGSQAIGTSQCRLSKAIARGIRKVPHAERI